MTGVWIRIRPKSAGHKCDLPDLPELSDIIGSIWECLECNRRYIVHYSDSCHGLVFMRRWLPWPKAHGPVEIELEDDSLDGYASY